MSEASGADRLAEQDVTAGSDNQLALFHGG